MKYGYFDVANKEYVITRPDTPLPWINYLGCEDYCALISNTAGGYSFYKDPRERRILRYRYNNIPADRGGRYLYIRDNKSKDFWSASWQPVLKSLDKYECRHGLGYTIISSKYANVSTKTTYFVPLGENLEIWILELKNDSQKPRDLTVISFVEFCLWDALNDMTDYQYNLNIGETDFKNGIIYHLTSQRAGKSHFAYFACLDGVKSYETERDKFLGPYGSLENPLAASVGKGSNSLASGWAPIGSHFVPVRLKPKEEKTLIFILGYSEKRGEERQLVQRFKDKKNVAKELERLKAYWEGNLSHFSVETPDPELNVMVNLWNQYQCRTTFNWSRSASYYESGIGRGMGFRDSNQDTLGFVHQIPEKVRERIFDLASNQFQSGDAYHQYSPLTKKGNGSGYSDDHLWLILATSAYLKETGDHAFLEEQIPYAEGGKDSLFKHLEKALAFTLNNLGPHKLPLIFFADWNDCLTLTCTGRNQAESVLVGELLVVAATEMAKLAGISKHPKEAQKYQKIAEEMSQRINKLAWDKNWYLRAFDDWGHPVGSKKNPEGKIHLETQCWSVLSGVADKDRARKAMDSVKKYLATPYGIMLLQPGYTKVSPPSGFVGIYPPGLKENGAIFCHPNGWAVIAECKLGRGDQAFKYYKAILPAAKNQIADIHRVEPYVYCQMIAGKEHKAFGEGKNSWLTGSAAWNLVAVSQWIFGIRPDYKGLLIDPCIPKKWNGFKVKRRFRGADYLISVSNPKHVNKGIKEIKLDGKKIIGNILPSLSDRKAHQVEVIMG